MANPIESTKFIHKAIRTQAEAIAQAASGLNEASEQTELTNLSEQVAYLQRVEEYHSAAEEQLIFPALQRRADYDTAPYLLDHAAGKQLMAGLAEGARAWGGLKSAERESRALELAVAGANLAYHQGLHIQKEETLIIPLLVEQFSPAEQAAMVMESMGLIPDDFKPTMLPWIFRALEADERAGYLTGMLKVLPGPAHPNIAAWLEAGLPADNWSELARRVPAIVGGA